MWQLGCWDIFWNNLILILLHHCKYMQMSNKANLKRRQNHFFHFETANFIYFIDSIYKIILLKPPTIYKHRDCEFSFYMPHMEYTYTGKVRLHEERYRRKRLTTCRNTTYLTVAIYLRFWCISIRVHSLIILYPQSNSSDVGHDGNKGEKSGNYTLVVGS